MNGYLNCKWILGLLPFMLVMWIGYEWDCFPKRSFFAKVIKKTEEKELKHLMNQNGMPSVNPVVFMCVRILLAILCFGVWMLRCPEVSAFSILQSFLISIVTFKFPYVFLLVKEKNRIAHLNQCLPYTVKTICYLCYLYPLTNALEKSIQYIPKGFHDDVYQLILDVDVDPLSFHPYQKWIEKYHGNISNLDFYLKQLYRIGQSSGQDQRKVLSSLNSTVGADTRRVRKQKNDSTNSMISWLGMMPVLLLGFMLALMMFIGVLSQI